MRKSDSLPLRPQHDLAEQHSDVVASLSPRQVTSLYKKSRASGFSFDLLEQVFARGVSSWTPDTGLSTEEYAFNRVNSFINGGKAAVLDAELLEQNSCPSDREVGTDSLARVYRTDTPGQDKKRVSIIKRTVNDTRGSKRSNRE